MQDTQTDTDRQIHTERLSATQTNRQPSHGDTHTVADTGGETEGAFEAAEASKTQTNENKQTAAAAAAGFMLLLFRFELLPRASRQRKCGLQFSPSDIVLRQQI